MSGPQAPHWVEHGAEVLRWWTLEGLSASLIARRLAKEKQVAVSRNAVIGFVTRHGHNSTTRQTPCAPPSRFKAPKIERRVRSATASARNIGRATRSDGTLKSAEAPKPLPVSRTPDAPAPLMVRPVDLESHHCRWPIGDPMAEDFGFCGHARAQGPGWYCPAHERAAANPNAKRKDEKSLARMIYGADRRRAA